MDKPKEDTNFQTKRKIDDIDVHDDGAVVKRPKASDTEIKPDQSDQVNEQYNLLHFSDDVMLYILQYCSPRELKVLSFCCRRLARLCMDRSLWRIVELRQQASGSRALSFYVHCLRSSTTSFYIRGLIGAGSVKNDSSKGAKKHSAPVDCQCQKSDFIGMMRKKNDPQSRNCHSFSRSRTQTDDLNGCNERPLDMVMNKKNNEETKAPNEGECSSGIEPPLVKNEVDSSTSNQNFDNSSLLASKSGKSNKKLLNWLANKDDDQFENEPSSSNSDANQPGPSSFYSTNKPHKENGNTSPKPFSAGYEDCPYVKKVEAEKKKIEKNEEHTYPKRCKKNESVADCCRNKAICLATITKDIMMEIKQRCDNLNDLRLEYCNLDCNAFPISEFPKNLKILSLKGCKRTNLPFQKTYLFKIQDHLESLEELDLSYCSWFSGHSLLLLSKLKRLKKLWLRGCISLGECVAYASLSTRFGFKSLELLDIRGTSLGDSEVSGFGSLQSLRELYLEPPKSDNNLSSPTGWAEHSGLMEPWETKHPHNEVEEYIQMMNDEELMLKQNNEPNESSSASGNATGGSENKGKKTTESNGDDDAGPSSENIGLFYRSILNLSYQERIPFDLLNDQQRPNNDNAHPDPPPIPERGAQGGPENGADNPMGVHVGPVGVQVGPLGVQVGPLRVQMRQRPDVPQPEAGEGQQGMGGVQVGPVEVQVGPDGVQVGLGGVRVDPGWMRAGQDAGVQVELGGVRVDPGWMHIGPEGVQVEFGGVQVGQAQDEGRDGPVEVQVGPIEVQVGAVRVEVNRDGRQGRDEENNDPALQERERIEVDLRRPPTPADDREPNNMNNREPRAQPRRGDRGDGNEMPLEFAGVRINPFWMQMEGGNENQNERMIDLMGPVGVHLHLRHRHGRRHREREQGENAQQNVGQPNNNNPQANQDQPRVNPEQPQRQPDQNPRHMNWIHVEPEGVRVAIGEVQAQRGLVIGPGIRLGNINVRPGGPARPFGVVEVIRENANNRPGNPEAQDENPDGDRENPEEPHDLRRENPNAPRENNDERRPNRDRPSLFRRGGDANPQNPPNPQNLQNRPNNPHAPQDQARQEMHHNIMDGRVHVIYVDPRYPRRPAAEVLVAGGMPRNAEVMIHEDGNAWAGQREFHLREIPPIFDMPLIQLPFVNLPGNLRHLDGAELVTDVSLLRLGESEQLVHVGGNRRRRTSNLEVLVCRGYRGVTDQSLTHLAGAAPALRHLDIEDCGVTAAGVAAFAMHRPDCKLHHNVHQPAEERNN